MTNTPNPEAPATGTEAQGAVETPAQTVLTAPDKPGEGTVVTPATESKPASTEPEAVKYDLKLPDGSALDPKRVGEIADLAKANGLKPEVAQEILNAEHGLISQLMESVDKEVEATAKAWESEVKAKYGEETTKKVELAKRALKRFDRSNGELMKALDETGYGNHPLLVDLLVAVGETMSEDTLVPPGGTPPKNEVKPTTEVFYPSSTPK